MADPIFVRVKNEYIKLGAITFVEITPKGVSVHFGGGIARVYLGEDAGQLKAVLDKLSSTPGYGLSAKTEAS
jgi:hypothetical protein